MTLDNQGKKRAPREIAQEFLDNELNKLADLKKEIVTNGVSPEQNNNGTSTLANGVPGNSAKPKITEAEKERDTYRVEGGNESKGEKVMIEIAVNPEILNNEMSKTLPTLSLMSPEEIKKELKLYGVEITEKAENNIIDLRELLKDARNTIAIKDKNSDIIDFHIGTFIQQEHSKYCSVLAQLDNMTDDEIREMIEYEEESDRYKVKFPNGDYTYIKEEDLNSGSVTVDGENITLNDLPKGDKDVKLITMAYVQIFGTYIVGNGERQYKAQNKFRRPTEPKLMDNQYFEDIQDYTNLSQYGISTVGVLNNEELKRKGFDFIFEPKPDIPRLEDKNTEDEARLSGAVITTLSNGKNICITASSIYISDGTLIPRGHAMAIRGYDENSEELIVTESEYNNISELRIPKEIFKFLEVASIEGTPGVDRTPQPDE